MLSKERVLEIFDELEEWYKENGEGDELWQNGREEPLSGNDRYSIKNIDIWCENSDAYVVHQVTDNQTGESAFIRFEGWYGSWSGYEFEDSNFEIVEKKQVIVEKWVSENE